MSNNCCQSTNGAHRTLTHTTEPPAAAGVRGERTFEPRADIIENAEGFTVVADVPGASAEQIEASLEDGVLTLRAPIQPRQPEGTRWLIREYGVGAWERSFRVGEGVDASRISAVCRDGVLTLSVPKAEHARPRKIEVRAS